MDALIQLDKELLLFLNGCHSDYWDMMMMFFTRKEFWFPLYIVIVYQIYRVFGRQGFIWLLGMVLLVFLCDQISTTFFKDVVQRWRPSHYPGLEGVVKTVAGYKGGKFGFVSSHATNSFGFALFSSMLFYNRLYTAFIFLWAFLMSYTRIYLGLHFPGDIVGGIILGLLLGWSVFSLVRWFARRWMFIELPRGSHRVILSYSSAWLIIGVVSLEIVTISLVLRKLVKYFPL